jgi:hypothetical protein
MSRRESEKKKKPFIVATNVYASSQGQRTHSARTNFQISVYCLLFIVIGLQENKAPSSGFTILIPKIVA